MKFCNILIFLIGPLKTNAFQQPLHDNVKSSRREFFKTSLITAGFGILASNTLSTRPVNAQTAGMLPDMVGGLKKPSKAVGGLTKKIRAVGNIMYVICCT